MRVLFFLGFLVLPVSVVQAQSAAVEALPQTLQSRVVDSDPLMDFRTQSVPQGRVDRDTGVLRAAYRLAPTVPLGATHEATARAYLDAEAERFGWAAADDLLLIREVDGHYSAHLTFQQTFGGIPVHNRFVKVNMGPGGHPSMVLSGYAPHLREADPLRLQPLMDASGAVLRTQQETLAQRVSTPQLVVYPSTPPRLAWHMIASPDGIPAEWEMLMDADTGEILYLMDQAVRAHTPSLAPAGPVPLTLASSPAPAEPAAVPATHAVVNGTGLVFDPDPLTSAGVLYGGAYMDYDDADVAVLNAERKEVVLRDITLGTDGLYRLIGPYVEIARFPGEAWTPPAEADPDSFRYGRANDSFEAVMVYHHVDQNQRYVQSLNVGYPIAEYPIRAFPHGLSNQDRSYYFSAARNISFGDGGIDNAEDADMVLVMYAFALADDSVPRLFSTLEGAAFFQGWPLYWIASYSRGLVKTGRVPAVQDWRKVYNWDGNETWNGRRLDKPGRYPEDTRCDDGGNCNIYEDGRLWATTMMEIYDDLGKTITDRLTLTSIAYLSVPATFADAAEALLQADEDLYSGRHRSILTERLAARGYLRVPLRLSVSPSMVAEGDTAVEARVTAKLDEGWMFASAQPVTVSVGVSGDSAIEGTDYAMVEDFVIMIPGGFSSATGTFTLNPIDDNIFEGSETASVEGSMTIAEPYSSDFTITDNDVAPSVTLSVSLPRVAEDVGTAEVTVTATVEGSTFADMERMTVSIGAQGDSAIEGTDYGVVEDFVITIPGGFSSATGTFTLNPIDDIIFEGSETASVEGLLSGGTVTPTEITITDNDAQSDSLMLTIRPESVGEDAGTVSIQVMASLNAGASTEVISVTISVTDGTAESGNDYSVILNPSPLEIPAGMASVTSTVELSALDDDVEEEDETIIIGASTTGLTPASQEFTITNDDVQSTALVLTIRPESVREDAGTVSIEITASLNDAVRSEATAVTITVMNGTALLDDDYRVVTSSSPLEIPVGMTSIMGMVEIEVLEDDLAEGNETIVIGASATGLTPASQEFTITDNDVQSTALVLTINPESVGEDAGTSEIEITASLNDAVRSEATAVTITVTNGTALLDDDYRVVTSSSPLMIPAGMASIMGTIEIEILEDDVEEGNETIVIGASATGLASASQDLVITDDDASLPVTLSVSPPKGAEDVGTAEMTVTATVEGGTFADAERMTVSIGAQGDSAIEGTDYAMVEDFVITIPGGFSSATGTFTLNPIDDNIFEGSETASVEGLLSGGMVTPTEITITDNDVPSTALVLTVVPARLHEDSGTSWVRFTAGLNDAAHAMDTPVDVSITEDGTAIADADYNISVIPSSMMIPAGETSISDSLQITITDDDEVEGNETVTIEVSATGLAGTTQNLVIIDDETAVRIDVLNVIAQDGGSYTVTAAVRQNMGAPVTSVVLHYGDGITFETTPMQTLVTSSNSSYRAELLAPDEGGILYYYVVATNGDGLTARYPAVNGRYWDVNDYIDGSRLVFLDFEDEDTGDKSAVMHHVAYKGDAGALAEGALALDGVDDHVEILGSSLGASEEFALELMFNADDFDVGTLDAGGRYLVAKPGRPCDTCWEEPTFSLLWGGDSNSDTYVAARFWNTEYEGEQVELEVPLSLVAGQWYHAILEVQKEDAGQRAVLQLRDGSGMLYGEDAAVLSAPPSISTHPVFVGHIGDRGFFDGRIDNVAFYNYAHFTSPLTSVEDIGEVPENYVLEQNYPNPFNPVVIPPFLVLFLSREFRPPWPTSVLG